MLLPSFSNMQQHKLHHHMRIITISFPITTMPSPYKKSNTVSSPMDNNMSTSNDTNSTPQSDLPPPQMLSLAAAEHLSTSLETQANPPHLVLLCLIGIPDNTENIRFKTHLDAFKLRADIDWNPTLQMDYNKLARKDTTI
jgi:hypothetical protein